MAKRPKTPPALTPAETTVEPTGSATPQPSRPEPSVTDQLLALRTTLREALERVNGVARAIKRQKKQEKFLRATLASLKELQSVA